MAPNQLEFTTALEQRLKESLSALARTVSEVGAQSVSVILLETDSVGRVVYRFPQGSENEVTLLPAGDGLVDLRRLQQPVIADCELTGFLNSFLLPTNETFLLLPWPEGSIRVIMAFGFARSGASLSLKIPHETSSMLQLAALATGAVFENRMLRRNLFVVNERLGQRKIVERAKGLLQAQNGWSEQEAYSHLRNLSRQRRRTLAATAEDLLRTAGRAGPEAHC